MSTPLIIACLWVVASAITATQPMRRQYVPGVILLLSAPILLIWLSVAHGWWVGAIALLGFVSMFRNPLRYLLARARGEKPEVPR